LRDSYIISGHSNLYVGAMNDFGEITRALKYETNYGSDSELVDDDVDDIVGVDKYETLSNRVIMLTNENIRLRERVDALEARLVPMFLEFSKGATRSRVSVRDENTFRASGSGDGFGDNSDTSSYVHTGMPMPSPELTNTRTEPSAVAAVSTIPNRRLHVDTLGSPSQNTNPFTSYNASAGPSQPMFKSNSATAPQGYTQKTNVWGTALASLMVGSVRYYATKKSMTMTMVDEPKVAKVYTSICSMLYEAAMCKPLPSVTEASTFYLANAISRINKKDTPLSNASDWLLMESCQEGRDVMSVLRVMVKTAKLVPEAMVHPISQLLPYMRDELVTQVPRDGKMVAVFAISAQVAVSQTPDPWEMWCGILKKAAIVRYVKHRTAGRTPIETIHTMSSEMKPSELADKTNWNKLTDLSPIVCR
jgi:hypothetical protein